LRKADLLYPLQLDVSFKVGVSFRLVVPRVEGAAVAVVRGAEFVTILAAREKPFRAAVIAE